MTQTLVALSAIGVLLVGGLASATARDYLIDANGADDNDGSEQYPLRTISRANELPLAPGDRLLFRAGQVFRGNLVVADPVHGTAQAPIVIGSLGAGRATIDAGPGTGVWIRNCGGVVIQDLVVHGSGPGKNVGTGVRVENTLPGTVTLDFVRIARVTCSGFAGYPGPIWNEYGGPSNYGEGFFIGGRPYDFSKSGYRDVRIDDCEAYDNQYYGILFSGAWNPGEEAFANIDVHVTNCLTHHNSGDPAYRANHSGNGILLEEVQNGVIEHCQAWENGALCASAAGGPVGIWAAAADHILIRDCLAYSNRTASTDGGGFDFDGGVSNSTIEECTSHDNEGAGILLYSYPGAPHYFGSNVVRNCLSANDGKKNGLAGIAIGRHGGRFEGVEVYNNIIFASAKAGAGRAVTVFGLDARHIQFHGNLVVASNGAHLIEAKSQPGITFFSNAYWSGLNPFAIVFDGKEYNSVADLRAATGQEAAEGGETPVATFAKMPVEKLASWLDSALTAALSAPTEHKGSDAAAPRADSTTATASNDAKGEKSFPGNLLEMLGILFPSALGD